MQLIDSTFLAEGNAVQLKEGVDEEEVLLEWENTGGSHQQADGFAG